MEKDEATRKFNLSLPAGLMDELYRATGAGKRGRKQQVLTAAALMFLEAAPELAERYLRRVGAASTTDDGYERLLAEVRAIRKPAKEPRRPIVSKGGVSPAVR